MSAVVLRNESDSDKRCVESERNTVIHVSCLEKLFKNKSISYSAKTTPIMVYNTEITPYQRVRRISCIESLPNR